MLMGGLVGGALFGKRDFSNGARASIGRRL